MINQRQPNGDVRVVPVPYSRRKDLETAKIVSQGIVYQNKLGTDFAAAYLSGRGISVEVALRVLSRPQQRR